MVKDSSITAPLIIEKMRIRMRMRMRMRKRKSVLDFFEKLLSPEIQSRDKQRTPSSLKVKVSVFPKIMHLENLENVEFQHQPSFKVKSDRDRDRVRLNVEVESMVNSGYPFVYFFRKGGRNGHRQETFYA